jgi:hypothetical protein
MSRKILQETKQLKVKYVYIEPTTPEEKAEQERKLDTVYDLIFNAISK